MFLFTLEYYKAYPTSFGTKFPIKNTCAPKYFPSVYGFASIPFIRHSYTISASEFYCVDVLVLLSIGAIIVDNKFKVL